MAPTVEVGAAQAAVSVPRVRIEYCTQCRWMLRAAYFAQELLSTFSTALGEVALAPATGGKFVVEIEWNPADTATSEEEVQTQRPVRTEKKVLWDRKAEGGFPETKELKRRVRDVIEPGRDLGHVDRKKDTVKDKSTKTQPEKLEAENCPPGGCD